MKQLFAIACTLVLGSALSFAQTDGGKPQDKTPSASTTPGSSTDSTTTKKHHHGKKGKKAKKSADTTAAPAATPTPK
jgi:basic membrane lipoprotein Med (substrate-binding protein (PBP1-ABC) superfamily)